ncbi:hypothetical protein GGC47_002286 [Bosea sp. OAE752]|jgi:hypothetical protein|uniref:Uncharacterized protein n=1 Tax=Bosea spartocytisi TaxID=2773451 RepID=A0A927EAJ9_9HYPH|nr:MULTISPECIES: hypothetical protein [Bosea]MBD3847020.1 hypothetical protein [Bosea spartocytisi]MCT4474495.1 hypothetical protein [Bosea spartocytisi]
MMSFKRVATALTIALAASTVMAGIAEAQSRREPLRIIVQKRSYFDAGNVVPVGSMNNYASQHFAAAPVYVNTGSLYGESTLPGRVGSGANPFANTIETPRF